MPFCQGFRLYQPFLSWLDIILLRLDAVSPRYRCRITEARYHITEARYCITEALEYSSAVLTSLFPYRTPSTKQRLLSW